MPPPEDYPCPDCIGAGKCPRCGGKLYGWAGKPFDADKYACSKCGWTEGEAQEPVKVCYESTPRQQGKSWAQKAMEDDEQEPWIDIGPSQSIGVDLASKLASTVWLRSSGPVDYSKPWKHIARRKKAGVDYWRGVLTEAARRCR